MNNHSGGANAPQRRKGRKRDNGQGLKV